jgi:hypothetical protein
VGLAKGEWLLFWDEWADRWCLFPERCSLCDSARYSQRDADWQNVQQLGYLYTMDYSV